MLWEEENFSAITKILTHDKCRWRRLMINSVRERRRRKNNHTILKKDVLSFLSRSALPASTTLLRRCPDFCTNVKNSKSNRSKNQCWLPSWLLDNGKTQIFIFLKVKSSRWAKQFDNFLDAQIRTRDSQMVYVHRSPSTPRHLRESVDSGNNAGVLSLKV